MQTGFNTNIEHNGRIFHVQTEVQGGAHLIVETLIYEGGTIINSKKTPYDHLLQSETPEKEIRQLVEKQHIFMIGLVKAGKYGQQIEQQPSKSNQDQKVGPVTAYKPQQREDSDRSSTADDQGQAEPDDKQLTEKIIVTRELKKDVSDQIGSTDSQSRPVKSAKPTKSAGDDKKKYVSGAHLKKSLFLEKIVEQTDRLQMTKINRDYEHKNILNVKLKAVLDELEFLLEDIQYVAFRLDSCDLTLVNPNEQRNHDLYDELYKTLKSVHEVLNESSELNRFTEIKFSTTTGHVLVFMVNPVCYLTVTAHLSADIDAIRLAIETSKKQILEILDQKYSIQDR
ncbi:hypothetical protein JXQ70_20555 [bacterium]|nr:hypothetical protein [bacterium]